MTLGIDRFNDFFVAANGRSPFPWQARLANQLFHSGWPACIDLPTASGKTACIDIAIFVAACQASLPTERRTVGRRVFFTVNRRVIVDEAFERSKSLAQKLLDAESQPTGIMHETAVALRSLNEETDPSIAPPLAIAQLRGGVYRDATWSRSLTQPMVVCTTVDQLGSRMLFRGYGVSDNALPIHAALCSHDATILLDEAHVTKAFCETLALLDRYQHVRTETTPIAPPFRFVQMTATPQGDVEQPFQLGEDDFKNEVLQSRQTAKKPASLIEVEKKKSIADRIATDAAEIGAAAPRAVGIIVNRVQTAREVAAKIESDLRVKESGCRVHLVIGRMRPFDRDILQRNLRHFVGPSRPNVLEQSVYVVATQCLEVGADYDFDVMLTECASIDALRQRFGRLNRAGRRDEHGKPIEALAKIYFQPSAEKGDDPIYGTALTATWDWLQTQQDSDAQVDFGVKPFNGYWDNVNAAQRSEMLSPSPPATILLPPHLDLLCQTSPRPTPEPEISYFIHGPQRSNADVNVCWRADLGSDPTLWPDVVRLLPPTSLECMPVPIWSVRRWVAGQPVDKNRDTDVAVNDAAQDPRHRSDREIQSKTVLLWRGMGEETLPIADPAQIRPGDTIVISVSDGGWDVFGHIPGAFAVGDSHTADKHLEPNKQLKLQSRIDIAEPCFRLKNLRHVIRVHPAFPSRVSLRALPTNELRVALNRLTEEELSEDSNWASDNVETDRRRQEKAAIIGSLSRGLDRHFYPRSDGNLEFDGGLVDEVVYCRAQLPQQTVLELPAPASDDEDDERSQSSVAITLREHTTHVIEHVHRATTKLNPRYCSVFEFASRWHDLGKADVRFQAMLSGLTPSESIERELELAKSSSKRLTTVEREAIRQRSQLPTGFRHEFLSTQIVEQVIRNSGNCDDVEWELVLRLIESHHGYARPFAGVVVDKVESRSENSNPVNLVELHSVRLHASEFWPEIELSGEEREKFLPHHRLDSGVVERFWKLTRRFGWWGLAYLEAMQRLADQRASAAEELSKA